MKNVTATQSVKDLILGLVVSTVVIAPAAAQAAASATVNATVTVQNISVSVSDGSVTYGTLALNSSRDTTAGDLNDLQTATNDGNVTADINIRGQHTAAWTLAATNGANQYVHEFSTNAGSNWTALTTSNQTLADDLATSGEEEFDLKLTTPTSSSSYDQQSVDVTVQATGS